MDFFMKSRILDKSNKSRACGSKPTLNMGNAGTHPNSIIAFGKQ
jgi:hypothetical protein